MSNAKHTHGPWEAIGNLVRSPMSTDEETGGSGGGFLLAEVYGIELTKYTEEAKANARLIAAAPDLLEACKLVVEYYPAFGHLGDCEARELSAIAIKTCRAAIAKATGDAAQPV